MSISKEKRESVITGIIEGIGREEDGFSPAALAEKEQLSVQSIYRYLSQLETQGRVTKIKDGRRSVYKLAEDCLSLSFPVEGLSEDVVWKRHAAPFFAELPDIARTNLMYAFTEMLNNAIDHSQGSEVGLMLQKNGFKATVWIMDDGVGIFAKIAAALNLEEKSFAVLELAKGKFTTEPSSHTGEGIFFSSKVVDEFAIMSDGLVFLAGQSAREPFLYKDAEEDFDNGTTVIISIFYGHSEPSSEVFDRFTQAPEDYGFSKTLVPVRLLEYGDDSPVLVSRSQAKRLMLRFERFQNIILDFDGIAEIGQGFADELFRVFPSLHPGTTLNPVNCSEQVSRMILRVTRQS